MTHHLSDRFIQPTEEDYAEWQEFMDQGNPWVITEWSLSAIPPNHWLWRHAPPADPELQPIKVSVRIDAYGEPHYFVGGDAMENKEHAFSLARSLAKLQYGSAIRKYKTNLYAAKQREEYERRREEESMQSQAKVLMDILKDNPQLLDYAKGA